MFFQLQGFGQLLENELRAGLGRQPLLDNGNAEMLETAHEAAPRNSTEPGPPSHPMLRPMTLPMT